MTASANTGDDAARRKVEGRERKRLKRIRHAPRDRSDSSRDPQINEASAPGSGTMPDPRANRDVEPPTS